MNTSPAGTEAPLLSGFCGYSGDHARCLGTRPDRHLRCDCPCHTTPEPSAASRADDAPAASAQTGGGGVHQPMPVEDIDRELAICAILKKRIDERDAMLRKQRRSSIRPGQRSPVVLPGDDVEVAWVSMTKPTGGGALTAAVKDPEALLRWCRTNLPSAITETVRASDQKALLDVAKATGEAIDGVELSTTTASSPQLRVNVEDGAFERLLEAVRAGHVDTMLALGSDQ